MEDKDGSCDRELGKVGSRDPTLVLGSCGEVGVWKCMNKSLGSQIKGIDKPSKDWDVS